MNKHVPPSSIAGDETKSPQKTAPSGQGGEADHKEQPPKPAEAESPTPPRQRGEKPEGDKPEGDKSRGDKPQAEKPQADQSQEAAKPQGGEPDAAQQQRADGDSSTPESSPWRDRLKFAAVPAALVVGLILWWSWGGASRPVYAFVKATNGTVTMSVRASGTLAPHDSVDIVAPIGGRVQSVLAKSGDRVMKGQLLARLNSDSARDEALLAQTEFASMQARMAQAQADVEEARAAALRTKSDSKPGAYDTAQANLARAQARTSELQAQLRQAQAQVSAARAVIDSLDVRAPMDGVVLKTDIGPTKYVSAGAGGRALFTLASGLSQLKLAVDIPESQLGSVRVGEPAQFSVPALPRQVFPAILTALDLWPKRETKDSKESVTYSATLAVDNAEGALRPGMSANADIITAQARNVLVVPNQALTFSPTPDIESKYPKPKPPVPGGAHVGRVWILDGDTPEPRDVALGLTDGRITQVAAGPLRAGDRVITATIH